MTYDTLYWAVKDGKSGLINDLGKTKIPPIYDELSNKFKGLTAQQHHLKNQLQWLMQIDDYPDFCDGSFDENQKLYQSYEESLASLEILVQEAESKPVMPVRKDDKWGLINLNNETVLPFEYTSIKMLSGTIVQLEKTGTYTFYDLYKKQQLPFECDSIFPMNISGYNAHSRFDRDEFLIFRSTNGKFGLINPFNGKYLDPTFDALEQTFFWPEVGDITFFADEEISTMYEIFQKSTDAQHSNEIIRFRQNDEYGIIHLKSMEIITKKTYKKIRIDIEEQYQQTLIILDNQRVFLLNEGRLSSKYKLGYTLKSYKTNYYANAPIYFFIQENGQYGICDKDENLIIPIEYTGVSSALIWDDHSNQFIMEKEAKWGLINEKNQVLIPFEYDQIEISEESDGFWYKLTLGEKSIYKHFTDL